MEIIHKENYQTSAWTGGVTRQVCILPQEGSRLEDRNFDVRVSSAVINTPESTFSDFAGFTRHILCLQGNITLCVDGQTVNLSNNSLFTFDGAANVTSHNSPGAVDLNVIHKKGMRVHARVAQGENHFSAAGRMLVFAIGAETRVNSVELGQHDAAWVHGDVHINGHVLCVEI